MNKYKRKYQNGGGKVDEEDVQIQYAKSRGMTLISQRSGSDEKGNYIYYQFGKREHGHTSNFRVYEKKKIKETVKVRGCTDPSMRNYNPSANVDDGSCLKRLKIIKIDPVPTPMPTPTPIPGVPTKVKVPCHITGTCPEPYDAKGKKEKKKSNNKRQSVINLVNGKKNRAPSLYGHNRKQRKVFSKDNPLDFLNPAVIGKRGSDRKGKRGRFLGLFEKGGVRKHQTGGKKDNSGSGLTVDLECITGKGKNCKNPLGLPFQLGITGGLEGNIKTNNYTLNGSDAELPNITGSLGGKIRIDAGLFDEQWNPAAVTLGYNRKQRLLNEGNTFDGGTDNVYARFGRYQESKAPTNDWAKGDPSFKYGVQGNYDITNNTLDNIGVYGQWKALNGSMGINPNTGKPNFKLGLSHTFQKGGVRKYQTAGKKEEYINRLLPEINVSALTDASYNKLSAQDKKLYDMFIDKKTGDITQMAPFSIDGYKGELHWEDVLGMSKNSGGVTIENEPMWHPIHKVTKDENDDFRAHASPWSNSIHIPRFHEEYINDDNVTEGWGNFDDKTGYKWLTPFTPNKYIPKDRNLAKKQFMSKFIAELGHKDKDVSIPWKGSVIPSVLSRMYRSVLGMELADDSNYHDEYDGEYYTHFGENSGESQVVKKNLTHPSSYMERSGDFRETNTDAYKKGYKNWGNMIINNLKSTFRPSIFQKGGVKTKIKGELKKIKTQAFSNIQVDGTNWAKGVPELTGTEASQGVNVSGINLSRNFKLNDNLNMSLSNPGVVYARPTLNRMPVSDGGEFKILPFDPKVNLSYTIPSIKKRNKLWWKKQNSIKEITDFTSSYTKTLKRFN